MARTILLADDSVTIQKVVELTFLEADYQVVAVSDGSSALTKLPEVQPDLIIADVHMPGVDGYEVCQQSKASHPHIPVLLLVGTFEMFDEPKAGDVGADGHLKKPFDSQDLLQQVEALITRAATETVPMGGAAAPVATPAADAFDMLAAPAQAAPAQAAPAQAAPVPVAGPPSVHPGFAGPAPSGDRSAEGAHETAPQAGLTAEPQAASVEPPTLEPAAPSLDSFADASDEPTVPLRPMPSAAPSPSFESIPAAASEAAAAATPAAEPTPVAAATPAVEPTPVTAAGPAAAPAAEPASVAAEEPSSSKGGLSEEDVERIAQRVLELAGEKMVRDVAWEVVPDLAEVLIRERIRELESQVE